MQHADFLNVSDSGHYHWRLTNWPAAIRIVLGGRSLILFRTAFVIVLAPAVLLAFYSLYSSRPALLILVFLSFLGFGSSSTGPTGIGMVASLLTAVVGFVISVVQQDSLLGLSCVLPGGTWLGSCAVMGITAQYLIEELEKSEALFQTLLSRGILKPTDMAERSEDNARC